MTDKETPFLLFFRFILYIFLYYINANIIILKHYLPYMFCILPFDMTKVFG